MLRGMGLHQKAAIGAVENDGGKHASLFNHRADAPDAYRAVRAPEPDRRDPLESAWNLPDGSPAHHAALANIRRVLVRRDLSPGWSGRRAPPPRTEVAGVLPRGCSREQYHRSCPDSSAETRSKTALN